MHIVFRVELSSVLCVVCDYSLMSEVTRAYPLLVWRVTLGLPISLIDYAYYYYYLVFRFRSRNALTPVEVIDLPAWVSMSLSYTIFPRKPSKGSVGCPGSIRCVRVCTTLTLNW